MVHEGSKIGPNFSTSIYEKFKIRVFRNMIGICFSNLVHGFVQGNTFLKSYLGTFRDGWGSIGKRRGNIKITRSLTPNLYLKNQFGTEYYNPCVDSFFLTL